MGRVYFTTIILCGGASVIDCFATISWTSPQFRGEDEVIVTIILAFSMERYPSMTGYCVAIVPEILLVDF
jgi:hypothetical protein